MSTNCPISENDSGTLPLTQVAFDKIAAWPLQDHASVLTDMCASCERDRWPELQRVLSHAGSARDGADSARDFFETHFRAFLVDPYGAPGLVTGYFEPELAASRERKPDFPVPLYRRPADLVAVVDEHARGVDALAITHMRQTGSGLEQFPPRADIEAGALARQGLELCYLACPVDAFLLHVQGSGLLRFDDGSSARVTYDGKNGYPYTSIGRHLIDAGEIAETEMSLETLAQWLRADPVRARAVMQKNVSFVFFRELPDHAADCAHGVNEIPLKPFRSLAVDGAFHRLGTPILVEAPGLRLPSDETNGGFAHLMIAEDAGSAITGRQRGDVFFGSGDAAGRLAGHTNHAVRFTVLLPNNIVAPSPVPTCKAQR